MSERGRNIVSAILVGSAVAMYGREVSAAGKSIALYSESTGMEVMTTLSNSSTVHVIGKDGGRYLVKLVGYGGSLVGYMDAKALAHVHVDKSIESGRDMNHVLKIGDSHSLSPYYLQNLASQGPTQGAIQGASSFHILNDWPNSRTDCPDTESPLQCEMSANDGGKAVVWLGTNDVELDANSAGYSVADYIANMNAIVGALTADGIVPVIVGIPLRADKISRNSYVSDYNSQLAALCGASGFPFVDTVAIVGGMQRYGTAGDGIHLAKAAYDKLNPVIATHLSASE